MADHLGQNRSAASHDPRRHGPAQYRRGAGRETRVSRGRNSTYLVVARASDGKVLKRVGPLYSGVRPFTINGRQTLGFTTATGFLGFQVSSLRTGKVLYTVPIKDFNWNPRTFGPSAPSHGISLSPNEKEVWVIDAPNGYVHVFDVTGLPAKPPRQVADIALPQARWRRESLRLRLRQGRMGPAHPQRPLRVRGRLGRRDLDPHSPGRGVPAGAARLAQVDRDRLAPRAPRLHNHAHRSRLRSIGQTVQRSKARPSRCRCVLVEPMASALKRPSKNSQRCAGRRNRH
jgi:hypothetical protein